jgi:hypothetical protein
LRLLGRSTIVILLLALAISQYGCGSTKEQKRAPAKAETVKGDHLSQHLGEDITATVHNVSEGYGPYSLRVEIESEESVRIYFPNGGWRDISLDEADPAMDQTWEGTDSEGNSWTIDP